VSVYVQKYLTFKKANVSQRIARIKVLKLELKRLRFAIQITCSISFDRTFA